MSDDWIVAMFTGFWSGVFGLLTYVRHKKEADLEIEIIEDEYEISSQEAERANNRVWHKTQDAILAGGLLGLITAILLIWRIRK